MKETNTIKIDKGIPTPDRFKFAHARYPFEKMKVGDSFLFPKEIKMSAAYAAAHYQNSKKNGGSGKQFIVRRTEDGSARCWRVE